jgi:hypothetical protein
MDSMRLNVSHSMFLVHAGSTICGNEESVVPLLLVPSTMNIQRKRDGGNI